MMGIKGKNIFVSSFVVNILDKIKERDSHSSYDSVVRSLLYRVGEVSQ